MSYKSVSIDCDGSWCDFDNKVVQPEVFGDGRIRVGILGEAPYKDEVREHRPFIGRSGQRLRSYMIPDKCTYYIFNVFSCLTYLDGSILKPSSFDVEDYRKRLLRCEPNRNRIFELLPCGAPIVAFGKHAQLALFGREVEVSSYPSFIDYDGKTFQCYANYHPAYMLYNPNIKIAFEEIMKDLPFFEVV